jgi:hypothetical protein
MENSGWAASAACPHYPTARVGHSRGFYRHFDFKCGKKTTACHTYVAWTNQYRMIDEHCDFGTIFNRKDDYTIMWVLEANLVEEATDKRTTW